MGGLEKQFFSNKLSKNGEYPLRTIPCQLVMRGVTTMIKDLNKRLYAYSMFDGHLMVPGGSKHACLVINMLQKNEDYIDKVIESLEELPVGYKKSLPEIYIKDGFNRQQQIRLQSHNHPLFSKIKERIYLDGRKVVDPHMLNFMDEEFLAIMFMADGNRHVDTRWKNARPIYRLHLNNLSYGDLMLIKKSFKDCFRLESNIRKKGKRYDLAIPTACSKLFEEIVAPFILPSFQYKIGR